MKQIVSSTEAYDLYEFSQPSGVIIRWKKLCAVDGASALKAAKAIATDGHWELWQDDKLIERWLA